MTRNASTAAWLSACLAGCLVALGAACGPPAQPVTDPLPGAEPMPAATLAAIRTEARRSGDAAPRTRHLRADGTAKYTNRLLLETSPYLRQHAHNPVNWYPWGEEAFDAARRLNRPVLLSIGYSTCHWCHVMEEESFEDEEIARFLNEHYVAIKVDREQRPDLDSIYMTAVQAMTGSGGWPMTVWLTPQREPFYGGTYFPARDGDRAGLPGFLTVLAKISGSYQADRARVASAAADLASHVREVLSATQPGRNVHTVDAAFAAGVFDAMLAASISRFDPDHGGTRGIRKFPSALPLRALLRHHRRSGNEQALRIVVTTLEKMAAGGIHDVLAGGFHRYSVDPAWRVPHFEKMLYDNALLAMTYTEAWQATGRPGFAGVTRDILAWVRREMTSPDGGFYSAIDADSRAPDGSLVEGYAYTWTPQETEAVLGAQAARLFDAAYGVTAAGNLEGRSVLFAAANSEHLAQKFSLPAAQVQRSLDDSRALLLAARQRRPQPLRDDKIVTAWNGLMISACARASMALGDADARQLGARAADSLLRNRQAGGSLVRSRVGERAQREAFLDDYAFLEAGLLDLFEAGDGPERLDQAIALDAVVERHFEDPAGGFFLTAEQVDAAGRERSAAEGREPATSGRGELLVREKPRIDGAEPSGNSVAIANLLRLAEWTGQERYRERADRALAALSGVFVASPLAASEALLALDFATDAPKEIVLVGTGDRSALEPLVQTLGRSFVPNRVVIEVHGDGSREARLPLAEDKKPIGGKPTAYVCENRVCQLPVHDTAAFAAQLRSVRPLRAAAAATESEAPPAPPVPTPRPAPGGTAPAR